MSRLVIDDNRTHKDGGTHVRTSTEAISYLSKPYDELWLDHDLGPRDNVMVLVDFMCEVAYYGVPIPSKTIYVHAQNPVGAENIIRALSKYNYNVKRIGIDKFL